MDATTTTGNAPVLAGRKEWFGLFLLALPTLLMSVDLSVLVLATPHITADLAPSSTEQLWILDIYGFLLAGFLPTMGALGDRIGRRKILMIGAAAFGIASLLAAFSTSSEMLIVSRALLGIAGATFAPSSLALLSNIFQHPKQRSAAIGIWMACFMGGSVLGPIVGGLMLSGFWWGSVFLLAVPVVLLVLVAGGSVLPEFKAPGGRKIDLGSVLLSLLTILPLIYGITEVAREGWKPLLVGSMVVGLVFGALFIVRQKRLDDPMIDLGLFSHRVFRSSFILSIGGGAIQGGGLLMVSLYLQTVVGLSPLAAGLWLVPTGFAMVVAIMLGGGIGRQVRPAYVMSVGLLVAAIGYGLLTQVSSVDGLTLTVIGFALAMAGIGPGTALGYELMMGNTPPEKIGAASASMEMGGQFGVAAGIALFGTVGTAVYTSQVVVPPGADAAKESVTNALAVAPGLGEPAGSQLLESARSAFTSGLNIVALVGAVLFVLLATLCIKSFRQIPPLSHQSAGGGQDVAPDAKDTATREDSEAETVSAKD
ncbi:MFS transporter [Amycolatopsis roodepoortensis]|uniref:DHA2 family multidrug resistance protein-like MFS transporter n=1 Tax=Amycolatopsis roodepoortensis TaxID=700274 RepID=A0ABR9L6G2_9PSEU|nr:MFS transporter [Amycolatopsis roodepoortensis]MBE1576304.1 DHA2 family multidrug resistance protein-like MFS transporter [Amycolatopsis roodepoortensis]UUV29047.1 MFS transporter [Amycolatopsis roodepoortensis]